MKEWDVYVFLFADGRDGRSVQLVGKVKADDALVALELARAFTKKSRDEDDRFGGIDVRRSDLPSLSSLLESSGNADSDGWRKQSIRYGSRPGRRSKKHREEVGRDQREIESFGEDWTLGDTDFTF